MSLPFHIRGGSVQVDDELRLSSRSGKGVTRGGTFGWKDLIGSVTPSASNPAAPTYANFITDGKMNAYAFAANDEADLLYHMPHDWAPGTDLYIHVHWGHNGTDISGSLVVDFYTTFARGFNQSSNGLFSAETNTTLTVSSLSITNTPQYRHRTDEVQLSAASPTANQIDTDNLEVDGLLLINMVVTTIPTITGSVSAVAQNKPFVFTVDLHYQTVGAGGTVNKAPGFYDT